MGTGGVYSRKEFRLFPGCSGIPYNGFSSSEHLYTKAFRSNFQGHFYIVSLHLFALTNLPNSDSDDMDELRMLVFLQLGANDLAAHCTHCTAAGLAISNEQRCRILTSSKHTFYICSATQIIATVDKRKGEWRNEQRVSHQSPDLKFKNFLES